MKNLNYNIVKALFVLCLILGPISCGKDDGPSEPSVEELIIGKWFLKATGPGPSEALGECERKSYLEFDTAQRAIAENFKMQEGSCTSNISLMEYALISDGRKIAFTSSIGEAVTVDILNLDENSLAIESSGSFLRFEK